MAPVGDDGLKVDGARELVELLRMPPGGSRKGTIVLGPMDLAQPAAADALLKTIEELDYSMFELCLWAHDLSEVMPTIQSRCFQRWCPDAPEDADDDDDEVYEAVMEIVGAYRQGDPVTILEALGKRKDHEDIARKVPEILASDLVAGRANKADTRLWHGLRRVLLYRNLSRTEVASALMPEVAA